MVIKKDDLLATKKVKTPQTETGKGREVESLIQAFEYFTETSERLRESYDKLQERISALDLELEKKNQELYANLREKDSIKNYLSNILESMTLGVVVVDLDGIISIVNRASCELTGYTYEQLSGKPYEETMGRKIPVENTLVNTLRTGKEMVNKEKEIITKNGIALPVEYNTSLVVNKNGVILGALEIFSDLREIKNLQEEVQQARTLAALGEMAGNVAHELRNPLGGIGGYAALLERDLDVEDPRRKLVQKIIEGVAGLNRVASNLLVYTRPIRPNKRPVDIMMVIEDVLMLTRVELEQDESKIKIRKYLRIKEFELNFDPELFHQVFLNLIKNAVQAMNDEGTLSIGVKNLKKEEKFEIYVKDTGTGIPEEDRGKLFLPFFTTKTDGTGLGLSIAKKIMDAHLGDIIVESEIGSGTIFRIRFPY
ncbi:MAG: PAS domain S-box protein [bacterium]|nr:PAS domain S-box protein [bacterium]